LQDAATGVARGAPDEVSNAGDVDGDGGDGAAADTTYVAVVVVRDTMDDANGIGNTDGAGGIGAVGATVAAGATGRRPMSPRP
jgi:hypothetical protein